MEKKTTWEDWINMFLGAWVFIIPWAISHNLYGSAMTATIWNFWIVGAIIFITSALALRNIRPWKEWTNIFAGVWLIISPWIFGFTDQSSLMWNALVVGLVVTLFSAMALPMANADARNNMIRI